MMRLAWTMMLQNRKTTGRCEKVDNREEAVADMPIKQSNFEKQHQEENADLQTDRQNGLHCKKNLQQ